MNGDFRRKELTLDLEYNVDSPSAGCDRYDDFIFVPNGKTGSTREHQIQGKMI